MKIDNANKNYITDLIEVSKNILVLCANRGNDALGAGIGMASFLDDNYDKNVSLVYNGDYSNINPDLLTLYEIQEDLDAKTLKLSLDFNGTKIDTVNYYKEEGNKLVLEINPVDRAFNTDRIKYNFIGKDYDMIFVIGAKRLESLGDIYTKNKNEFETAKIINIDTSKSNENYGKINVVDSKTDSLSSLVLYKFGEWRYTPSKDAGQALLIGMQG